MPCPILNCRGFLSTQYRCEICKTYTCPKCFEIIGKEKQINHVCNTVNIKTAEIIKRETKPCPSCGTRISKIDGCDQMWCIECHQAFSWRTGKIESGVIHNPHFYEYQRNNNNIIAPRNILCGVLCSRYQLENKILSKYKKTNNSTYIPHPYSITLCQIHRLIAHIEHVTLPYLRQRIITLENSKDLRVCYILKKITKERLKKQIYRNDIQRRKFVELLRIHELIHVCSTEMFTRLINEKKENNAFLNYSKQEIFESNSLRDYCNEQFKQIGITYNQKTPQINDIWAIEKKKFNIKT